MHCHICNQEAVGRCYNCGNLFCAEHGNVNCAHCETGIAEGDPRPDRITTQPRSSMGRPGWWRPQVAEDYEPPACYECKGLARHICSHCGQLYCSEHAGKGELCAHCYRSSALGLWILAGVGVLLAGMILVQTWSEAVQTGLIIYGIVTMCTAALWSLGVWAYHFLARPFGIGRWPAFLAKSAFLVAVVSGVATFAPSGLLAALPVWVLGLLLLFGKEVKESLVFGVVLWGLNLGAGLVLKGMLTQLLP